MDAAALVLESRTSAGMLREKPSVLHQWRQYWSTCREGDTVGDLIGEFVGRASDRVC